MIKKLVVDLNNELRPQVGAWVRIFLVKENGRIMESFMDPRYKRLDMVQEVDVKACPAVGSAGSFEVKNTMTDHVCPAEQFSFRSHVCVQIYGVENELFGVIFAGAEKPNQFQAEERAFLEHIGRSLGLSIQRLKRVDEKTLVINMDSCAAATFLNASRGVPETNRSILDGIISILKVEQASLLIFNKANASLHVADVLGPYGGMEIGNNYSADDGLYGFVINKRLPKQIGHIDEDPQLKLRKFPFSSVICFPIVNLRGDVLGVVNAWSLHQRNPFSTQVIDVVGTFLTRAAIALENARKLADAQKESPPEYPDVKAA